MTQQDTKVTKEIQGSIDTEPTKEFIGKIFNVVCRREWTDEEKNGDFIITCDVTTNIGNAFRSFQIGNAVHSTNIEPLLLMLQNEFKGSQRKILTLHNTHSIHGADDKDPLNFRDYDDNKIRERVIPKQLMRFFDIEVGEDLQDYEMFLLPTALGGFVNQKTIGHFVAISVNMKKQRFELLDSIKDYSEAKKFLSVVARKFKKFWREIGSKIQLSPSNIDHFKEFDVHVPLQGPDTLDSAFYMYMNVKHYSEEGTTMSLTEEQAPELRKRIMYHLLSEHISNANLVLLNCTRDMLKHKVVIEDEEMKEVQCDMVEVEIPQFAEEIDTSARDTQAVEVLEDSEDERKDDSQDLQWEHERKDPPIKSDRPPGPSKENIKIYEQRIIDERKRDAAISVPRETSKGVKRTVERNRAVRSTSCTGESLEFLRPKTLASEEEVTLFLESVSPAQVDTYNELVVKGQMDFQHFKTTLVMDKAYERLARLQSDSPDTSARQSSEITTANIISIKRPLKRSTKVYDVTNIPTFEHQHFIHMDKAKAIHDYLMSNEGQKECRNANLYKSAVCEECIIGQIMLDQLQKGGKGQMEATMCNALFEEWTEQKWYNTSDKAILTAEFANLVPGLEYEDGGLKEFNEDDSLQQFEATMKGINLLDKKLIMIPHNTTSHHMLYVLNKYENRLDILDSLDYKKCIKKTWRHQHRSCKELAALRGSSTKSP